MFDPQTGHITTIGFGTYTEGFLHGEDLDRAITEHRRGNRVALHGAQHRGDAPQLLTQPAIQHDSGWWFGPYVSVYRTPDPELLTGEYARDTNI